MPLLRLNKSIIEKAAELRSFGGSNGACARHAGVAIQTFCRWMHFGQALRDYIDNDSHLEPVETYRSWQKEAEFVLDKLQKELDETGGKLSREHRLYLKLWDEMAESEDVFIGECHETIDRAKSTDPAWALRGLRWFYPDDYKDQPEKLEVTGKDGGVIEVSWESIEGED